MQFPVSGEMGVGGGKQLVLGNTYSSLSYSFIRNTSEKKNPKHL